MPPEARLSAILARAAGRLRMRHALRSVAAGCAAAAVAALIARAAHAGAATTILAGVAGFGAMALAVFVRTRPERTHAAAARALERADPSMRNLVVTAQELIERPEATRPYMRARVVDEATRRAAAVDGDAAVPLSRDAVTAALAALAVIVAVSVRVPASAIVSIIGSPNPQITKSTAAPNVTIELVPPAYSGRAASRLTDPSSIEALAGTLATVRVQGAAAAQVSVNGTSVPMNGGAARTALNESGYVSVDAGPLHSVLPLTVTSDRVPNVRISLPGKDLRVATAGTAIPIVAEASDDLGLRSLEIRYTIVSGTGEQFTFTEGTMPAAIERGSAQSWRAQARLALAQMKLEPGDSLIYRAVAADHRPGDAGVGASDTFFVEIAGPGEVPLEGVEMPPDKERYALSQAMIVLKIQRLQARERSMDRPAVQDEAANIAAEQRAVRANFIFLLGGEVEDEEVEAEHSHEIQEGRLANQARREIVNATVLMARVEHALAAVSTREALPPAQEAVRALQRAFGRSRYLLRALPSRVRLDPARRLSGDLASAADWSRALAPPASDPIAESARAALTDLVAIARALETAQVDQAGALTRLAERVLAMAAAESAERAANVQASARDVLAARDALSAGRIDEARTALARAAGPIVARAQAGRIDAARLPRDAARLAGAAAAGGGGARR